MEAELRHAEPAISRHYSRAPITEAIIEIRFETATTDASGLEPALAELKAGFPIVNTLMELRASVSAGPQVGAQASQKLAGYSLKNNDLQRIVTISLDRFAFSQLRPYGSWEEFCLEARRLWQVLSESVPVSRVIRVATRFVNRIEIPFPITDIAEYFRTAPQISPDMSQELAGSFMQLQLPQKDVGCMVILNQALVGVDAGIAAFVLDIDVADEQSDFSAPETIWSRLNEFRPVKDSIFEACITDRVRELIS